MVKKIQKLQKSVFLRLFSGLAIFFIAGIIFGTLILTASFFFFFSGRVYPGVLVSGIALGRKTPAEIESLLAQSLNNDFPKQIILTYGERQWQIPTEDLDAKISWQKTASNAFSYGRKGTVVGNVQAITTSLIHGMNVPISLEISEVALAKTLSRIALEVDMPVEEPTILVESGGKSVQVTAGRDGNELRIHETMENIKNQLILLENRPIPLVVQPIVVTITKEEQEKTKERGQNLLSKNLKLKAGETVTNISGADLVNLINFTGGFNEEHIASITATIASRADKSPQDALIQFEGEKVKVFKPSENGVVLDQNQALQKITDALVDAEATTEATIAWELPMLTQPPKITTEQVNNLGIKESIGHGVSYFKGSIASRIHNIILASSRVSGTLVPPGETFSFAKAIGDISAATGYQQAYIIEKGRTVLGDGGGTCQVSTTLFRAMLDAGLPIEERHAHAYRVTYYEQGGWDPGFDATVFVPTIDLKFKNDTSAYILVQATVDTKTATLVFDLYGTRDGRKATVGKARIWDRTPALPERYEDDPTLPKGAVKQVDWAAAGAKAAFDYEVVKDGQIIQKQTVYSNFRPWQAVYLRGTRE